MLRQASVVVHCSDGTVQLATAKIFALHIWDSVTQPAALKPEVVDHCDQTPSGDCFPVVYIFDSWPIKGVDSPSINTRLPFATVNRLCSLMDPALNRYSSGHRKN